jgi:hypothetical protein
MPGDKPYEAYVAFTEPLQSALSVHDSNDDEVFEYHWHPDGPSARKDPHLHLGSKQLRQDKVAAECEHWPSGRVTFEGVIRQLITELGVKASEDWPDKLSKAEDPHLEHRTWP